MVSRRVSGPRRSGPSWVRQSRHAGLALLAALPGLACCTLGPPVPTPHAGLPANYESRTEDRSASVALDRWWTLYGDVQLEGLVEQALRNAPDARSAQARLKEALAVRAEALSAFAPQGALEGLGTRTDTRVIKGPGPLLFPNPAGGAPIALSLSNAGVTNDYTANFNVSWELDVFGRSFATRKKADADLATARFDYEASRTSLAANVADQLFLARGLAIEMDDARETARTQRDLLNIARERAGAGLAPDSDVALARSEVAQTDAQVADLETQLLAAKRTLLVLVGRGPDSRATLDVQAAVGTPPPIPTSVPAELLARRPDVRAAAARIASAAGALKLDELALFPKFVLHPGVGLAGQPLLGSQSTTSIWSIGLGLSQPILDMPRLKAEIRAQGARAEQAVINYEKTVQVAYGESDNALVQLGSDEARARLLTDGETQGRLTYDASRERYAAGVDDLNAVLLAERSWRNARTALTTAEVQAMRRSVQAFKALGGGWTPPALAVSSDRADSR